MACRGNIKRNQLGMFMIRPLKYKELDIIKDWYEARKTSQGWATLPPLEVLPFHEDGSPSAWVEEKDNTLLCCGWMYQNNSKLVVIDWFISNPRKKSNIKRLIKYLTLIAKKQYGCEYVMSLFDTNKILEESFKELGFLTGSKCTNYIKKI